jgi:hypothetical protein
MIYNLFYFSLVNRDFDYKSKILFPGPSKTVFNYSLISAIISGITQCLLWPAILIGLFHCRISRFIALGLFALGGFTYMTTIILLSIPLTSLFPSLIGRDLPLQETMIYNTSSLIQSYVQSYRGYASPTPKPQTVELVVPATRDPKSTPSPQEFCAAQYLPYSVEYPLKPYLNYLKNRLIEPGGYTESQNAFLSFTFYYSRLPLKEILSFTPVGNERYLPPLLFEFYKIGRAPICYGTALTGKSVDAAANSGDLCQLELTAVKCAPNWTVERLKSFLCSSFTNCVKKEIEKRRYGLNVKAFKEIGAEIRKTELESVWGLPIDWNNMSQLRKYWKKEESDEIVRSLFGVNDSAFYFLANGLWILLGIVGVILLFPAIVCNCLCGAQPMNPSGHESF